MQFLQAFSKTPSFSKHQHFDLLGKCILDRVELPTIAFGIHPRATVVNFQTPRYGSGRTRVQETMRA